MGFHWQWFGVKKIGPGVVDQILQAMAFEAREVRPDLTLGNVYEIEPEYEWSSVLGSCEFGGWTFLTGTPLFDIAEPVKIAVALNADVCLAVAESTTWALEMHYARPDGSTRSRSYTIEGADGKPSPIVVVVRKAGEGPLRRDETEGKEDTKGTPLPGEPLDFPVADDERLLRVLAAIGFPVGDLMDRYLGTYDWKNMRFVPGPGANDRILTAHIRGLPRQGTLTKPRGKGLLRKLFGR